MGRQKDNSNQQQASKLGFTAFRRCCLWPATQPASRLLLLWHHNSRCRGHPWRVPDEMGRTVLVLCHPRLSVSGQADLERRSPKTLLLICGLLWAQPGLNLQLLNIQNMVEYPETRPTPKN